MNRYDQTLPTSMPSDPLQQQPQAPEQQQQQAASSLDLDTVRQTYRSSLAGLTFNSKPMITGLTIKAEENKFAASAIVWEIEQQIRANAPGQKLPVLYLIDSICKNVGGPYLNHFARNIVSVFMDTYTLVDLNTRKSFERLLQTWKNGMPNGAPVFARHLIDAIEAAVKFIHQRQSPTQRPTSASPVIPTSTKAKRDPRNRAAALNNNATPSPPPSQVGYGTPPPSTTNPLQQLMGQYTPNSHHPSAPIPAVASPSSSVVSPIGSPHRLTHPPVVPPAPTTTPGLNTTDLLKNLLSQGILHSSIINPTPSTPPMLAATTPTPPLANTVLSPVTSNHPAMMANCPTLDSKDLQRERRGAIELLYSSLPLKCKQCGIRYPDTKEGKDKMDAHLDSHFRQNRRMKERVKRGLSRSWFVSEKDWIHGAEGELTSHQMPTFVTDKQHSSSPSSSSQHTRDDTRHSGYKNGNNATDSNGTNGGGMDKAEQLNIENKQLENAMVVMPHDGERKPCPICGESFTDVWNDDEEEWMYKNAVLVGTKIYHATCHTDAIRSGSLVKNVDVTMDSPDAALLGQKRKLEDILQQESKLPKGDRS